MEKGEPLVLTINAGSSSIKFSFRPLSESHRNLLSGQVDRVGLPGTTLTYSAIDEDGHLDFSSDAPSATVSRFVDWLSSRDVFAQTVTVGHRIVHGMHYVEPEPVTATVLQVLHGIIQFDPQHLPLEIKIIEELRQRYPLLFQVACFDTAFHARMPRVARLLPVPRRFEAMGIQRYGFHGLSYAFLMEELARIGDDGEARGRIILAHLGNGVSLCAVREGHSLDTSMSFTPCGGVPMSTRTGDLDPGIIRYVLELEQLSSGQLNDLINKQSGLLGVSETSPDMRDLLARRKTDTRASEAIEMFCYHIKKCIGAYAAVLGGLDTLVFSGGIGENAPEIRAGICDGLAFLGVHLEASANNNNASVISDDAHPVKVRVIATDEELMIARMTLRLFPYKRS